MAEKKQAKKESKKEVKKSSGKFKITKPNGKVIYRSDLGDYVKQPSWRSNVLQEQ